jgi:hypothetical protein
MVLPSLLDRVAALAEVVSRGVLMRPTAMSNALMTATITPLIPLEVRSFDKCSLL